MAQLLSMKSDMPSVCIMNNPDQIEINTLELTTKISNPIEEVNTISPEVLDPLVNMTTILLCIISILVSLQTVKKLSFQSKVVLTLEELVEDKVYQP